MQKKHGPDLKKAVPTIQRCRACRGNGFTEGVFFQIDCTACNGAGWVGMDGAPVEQASLIRALGKRVDKAEQELVARAKTSTRADDNNRRGAGGSHYSGD